MKCDVSTYMQCRPIVEIILCDRVAHTLPRIFPAQDLLIREAMDVACKCLCDCLPCSNFFRVKHIGFSFWFVDITVAGNAAKLCTSSVFLCRFISVGLPQVNATHLATTLTLYR